MASASPTLHRVSPELYDRLVDSGLLPRLGARLDLLRVQMPLAVSERA